MSYYKTHLFFCTNMREGEKPCCALKGSAEIREYAKAKIKSLHIHGKGQVRVSTSGCLGRCYEGPSLVIYPEGTWYSYRSKEDVDEIINEHILQGKIVERLLMESSSQ